MTIARCLLLVSTCVLATSFAAPDGARAQTGYGTILFENNTSITIDFYARGEFACRALSHGHCQAMVRAGNGISVGWSGGGQSDMSGIVNLASGETVTVPLYEEYVD